MQDKSYAVALVVVLGICCLGIYVAVSGYFNSNPSVINSLTTPVFQSTQVVVNLATDTPAPTKPIPTQPFVATIAPVPSPLGAFQTITAATTAGAPTALPTLPRAVASSTAASASSSVSCAGFQFCPKPGLADSTLAPTGADCPRNFVWGRIVDANGAGIPNARFRYKTPEGVLDQGVTKDRPDPPGAYNIPAPGGVWVVWVIDAQGAAISPQYTVSLPQQYQGAGNCPTRVDFFQQK